MHRHTDTPRRSSLRLGLSAFLSATLLGAGAPAWADEHDYAPRCEDASAAAGEDTGAPLRHCTAEGFAPKQSPASPAQDSTDKQGTAQHSVDKQGIAGEAGLAPDADEHTGTEALSLGWLFGGALAGLGALPAVLAAVDWNTVLIQLGSLW
ncbi:hypothetical protein [Corynebacterium sp.]|uniref:hypothetical protein n=1 Tax=Corynebacterium sp. TaxID=1720 RepID=UPI0026DC103F|nr:hypothetical protein [Corynebacterium sp.]MDO5032102.1 hypothetical protein [Corynebacterium sp.]